MKQRFNNSRESGIEVPLCFLQESNLQLFRTDFNLASEVVGQSTHLIEVCVRSTSLSESIEAVNILGFKLSEQIIQGCMVNVGFEKVFGQNKVGELYQEGLYAQHHNQCQNQSLIRQQEHLSEWGEMVQDLKDDFLDG